MAVIVTIDESKTQEEKPFPKLMIGLTGAWKGQICFFEKREHGMLLGPKEFGYADNFYMPNFSDYNEPVTLQNL